MALRTWVKPTLPKATVENPNDPVLGANAQTNAGPTHREAYSPWQYSFASLSDVQAVPAAPTAVGSGTGGTLAAATYTFKVTFAKTKGESPASAASSGVTTTGTASSVTVTVPAKPAWSDFVNVYASSDGTNYKYAGKTSTTTFTYTAAATSTLLAPAAGTNVTALVNH